MANLTDIKYLKSMGPHSRERAVATYDFSNDAGATGELVIFSAGEDVVVHSVYAIVETACTSDGSATVSIGINSDADGIVDPIAVASLTANAVFSPNQGGIDSNALLAKLDADAGVTDTNYEATLGNNGGAVVLPVRMAEDAEISMTIGTAALTAGKIRFIVEYASA